MSVQDKYDAVVSLIKEHNKVIGEGAGLIAVEQFLDKVKASGGTTEERLKSFSYEDILRCMPQGLPAQPIFLAKDIARIFRGGEESAERRPLGAKKAERMTPMELIDAYDPLDADNAVGNRLKNLSSGEPFIVFADDNGIFVDVDVSHKLLMEIKGGFTGRTNMEVNGEIKPVYKVGERMDAYADENPIYSGRPLRPDGTCDQTGRSWRGVATELRQFVRLIVSSTETPKIDKAHDLIDMVMSDKAMENLRKRYRVVSIKYDELKRLDSLPRLKVCLHQPSTGSLSGGKKVVWAHAHMDLLQGKK